MSVKKVWYTYDNIHETVKHIAEQIQHSGVKYDAMIAIGGGGFIPARMLRCFLSIPIYTVSTAYYLNESCGKTANEIQKTQWLNPIPNQIEGKNILVVDEVDDSRVTAEFVLRELQKENFGEIGFAVLHNKLKEKRGTIPENIHYFSGIEVEDWWINYPWDAVDIDAHNHLANQSHK
ncbi:phosphoribosyltransferase [Simonsiella muelleri]|uniref:phosphoribosyltransferase n=1 Tax=Simonsiella muelleri TaxID=72 RepID=UPI0028D4812E|nr:phosphoribosyltransferase [Simonsiella muelleri]